ncbi:UPAR/Ly6 domain-containing protein bou [Atheta coriaria]|uniref:UPAR/Ly6 domain-containing protein bou n=1 Tax=Dalotia coriaria TaxID=877792 RepID=UPI0031F437EB
MTKLEKLMVLCVAIVACVTSTLAIECYQCTGTDSSNPFQCNEWLSSDTDLQPQSCDDVYGAKYCVKHVGRFEASAILCYQCMASKTLDCSDGMIQMGGLEPQNCDHVFEAAYCVKSTGMEGGIGAKRFCSSLDLGNYCNYVRQPGDKLKEYRTCIHTCTGDGCNPATAISPNLLLTICIMAAIGRLIH